jgi:hypothetical protein
MKRSYVTLSAFERLLLLIATLARNPGIGCHDSMQSDFDNHDTLKIVHMYLYKLASELNVELPLYSCHTIQSDLKTLRRYGLLDKKRAYRWGYYLGTGVMNREELQVALNALHSQARYQEDPQINRIYQRLTRRLQGLNLKDEMFYPVRTQLNRVIVYTDPEEMMAKRKYRGTLFEKLDALEAAIIKGQAIELYRYRNPYNPKKIGYEQIYPLQLIYADIAWYLLQEDYKDGHLVVTRLDR